MEREEEFWDALEEDNRIQGELQRIAMGLKQWIKDMSTKKLYSNIEFIMLFRKQFDHFKEN